MSVQWLLLLRAHGTVELLDNIIFLGLSVNVNILPLLLQTLFLKNIMFSKLCSYEQKLVVVPTVEELKAAN